MDSTETVPDTQAVSTCNSAELTPVAQVERALEKATSIDEIRNVENLAQRARDLARAAGLGRDAVNKAGRIALDARRKAGQTLKLMKDRGELADQKDGRKAYHAGTLTLDDLGLTRNQSSRYQIEASVPDDLYQDWVRRVVGSDDGVLSAAGVRSLARQISTPDEPEEDPLLAPEQIKVQLSRTVWKLWSETGEDGKHKLQTVLEGLADECRHEAHAEAIDVDAHDEPAAEPEEAQADDADLVGVPAGDPVEPLPLAEDAAPEEPFDLPLATAKLENSIIAQIAKWPQEFKADASGLLTQIARENSAPEAAAADPPPQDFRSLWKQFFDEYAQMEEQAMSEGLFIDIDELNPEADVTFRKIVGNPKDFWVSWNPRNGVVRSNIGDKINILSFSDALSQAKNILSQAKPKKARRRKANQPALPGMGEAE